VHCHPQMDRGPWIVRVPHGPDQTDWVANLRGTVGDAQPVGTSQLRASPIAYPLMRFNLGNVLDEGLSIGGKGCRMNSKVKGSDKQGET
jgi:hypothetical protein